MARWKPMYDFLFIIIELFSLALTVEALQGKTCQDSLLSGGGTSVWTYNVFSGTLNPTHSLTQFEPRFQGEGVVPGEYFLVSTKLDTFCYLTVQMFWHKTGVWQTDRRTNRWTDGIAVPSTALAMRALWRAVKTHSTDAVLLYIITKLTGSNPNCSPSSEHLNTFLPLLQSEPTDPSHHTHFSSVHVLLSTGSTVNKTFVLRVIMFAILISKALRMARVNEGSHSFTCHPHIYPHAE